MKARTRTALALLLAATAPACGGGAPAIEGPNVLLISIDTLRADHLGAYGYERETSPALDALAASGTLFEDVMAPAPWTLPSHASLLTGRYPSRHGVLEDDHRLPASVPTLAAELVRHGYDARAIVNARYLDAKYGLDRGFEGGYRLVPPNPMMGKHHGPDLARQALDWMSLERNRPFFLFLHVYDVHSDFTPSPAYRERFVRPYDGPIDGSTGQQMAIRNKGVRLPEADLQHLIDLYDAEIRELDDVLAGFFDEMSARGLKEDTIVVVTSDHGEEFMDHGSLLHGRTHYQELLAIPLFLAGPGVPAGRRVPAPVGLIDVAPTLFDLVGVDAPPGMDGISLVPLMGSAASDDIGADERVLYAEADHNNRRRDMLRTIRIGNEKLILNRFSGETMLFNLGGDPLERRDLDEHDAARVQELRGRLEAWMQGQVDGERIAGPSGAELEELRALGYVDADG